MNSIQEPVLSNLIRATSFNTPAIGAITHWDNFNTRALPASIRARTSAGCFQIKSARRQGTPRLRGRVLFPAFHCRLKAVFLSGLKFLFARRSSSR